MTITEIITAGGGGVILLLALVEISPIKINPWSAIAKALGKAINAEVMAELETVKKEQAKIQKQLEHQKQIEDERHADSQRERILQFNLELIRKQKHTKESFNEIMAVMDDYEAYCSNNPKYPNNRARHAIANINRVYDELSAENGFLME